MLAPRYLQRAVNRILLILEEEGTFQAIRYASNLAAMCDAKVVLLYVLKAPTMYPIGMNPTGYPYYPPLWNAVSALEAHGREVLEKASLELQKQGVEAETRLVKRNDSADRTICETAEEEMCDMIVISDHPVRGIRRLFRRNVPAQVVERAHCPVIVVK